MVDFDRALATAAAVRARRAALVAACAESVDVDSLVRSIERALAEDGPTERAPTEGEAAARGQRLLPVLESLPWCGGKVESRRRLAAAELEPTATVEDVRALLP